MFHLNRQSGKNSTGSRESVKASITVKTPLVSAIDKHSSPSLYHLFAVFTVKTPLVSDPHKHSSLSKNISIMFHTNPLKTMVLERSTMVLERFTMV